MNAYDLINYFSSNLYFVRHENDIYLMDSYDLEDPEHDYGIYGRFSVDDLKDGNFDIDNIPDIYLHGQFEFLLNEDLEQTYGVPKEVIKELNDAEYSEWDIILSRHGFTTDKPYFPSMLDDVCEVIRTGKTDRMTEEEIEKYCDKPDDRERECIHDYESYQRHLDEEEDRYEASLYPYY